ncbi:UvrD-helicase domain-containing protein [Acidobacteriota bacterium]
MLEIQSAIIESSFNIPQLVLTGPGTGKTYCLIERLKHLYLKEGLNPGTEILVLSFSVAAIQEVKNRLEESVKKGEIDDLILYINIRTFDSFASHLMIRADPDISLKNKDYNARINMAIELISGINEAQEMIKQYKHVLIDEIQDLVGERAILSQQVLRYCYGGFTLFGDPAQSIYDYLMDEESVGPTSLEFLDWISDQGFPNLQCHNELKKNFRVGFNNNLDKVASEGRELILNSAKSKPLNYLLSYFESLPDLGNLRELNLPESICNSATAILTRTNGQLLFLAGKLYKDNIDFQIKKRVQERTIPSWIGRVFFQHLSASIKKDIFFELFQFKCSTNSLEKEEAWRQLKDIEGKKSNNLIDINILRSSLLHEAIILSPVDFIDDRDPILLSTIHRAKGREFDNVAVLLKANNVLEESEEQEEARVLYVALTRAKEKLFKISSRGGEGLRKIDSQERWIKCFKKKITNVEIGLDGDVDIHSFVSLDVHENDIEDIRMNQDDIWGKVNIGDEVELHYYKKIKGVPIYYLKVKINDNLLLMGSTSVNFGKSLIHCISEVYNRKPYQVNFPKKFDSIWVRDIVTEIGDLGDEIVPRDFRYTGIWLGLRVEGLGKCYW